MTQAQGQVPGRRERKKQRTRRDLIEAAYRLFDQQGYDHTTVAQIAEAADVSNATFFNHFPAKEDLLFAEAQPLLDAGLRVISEGQEGATPSQVLAAAMREIVASARGGIHDPIGDLELTRVRLLMSVPALQAATLRRLFQAQQQLARALHRAYPDELDELSAAIIVGSVTGAMLAAAEVSLRHTNDIQSALGRAFQRAIDTSITETPSGQIN